MAWGGNKEATPVCDTSFGCGERFVPFLDASCSSFVNEPAESVNVSPPGPFHPKQTAYFRGMKRDEWVAPIPGRPWVTGLYEMENSPR